MRGIIVDWINGLFRMHNTVNQLPNVVDNVPLCIPTPEGGGDWFSEGTDWFWGRRFPLKYTKTLVPKILGKFLEPKFGHKFGVIRPPPVSRPWYG